MKKSIDLSTTIGFWIRRLSVSILLAGYFSSPSLAQVKTVEIIDNPLVNEDRVTVRIKVKDANDKPEVFLQDTDFQLTVDSKPIEFRSKDWKSPEDTIPPPDWIIVLLDYSGSMNQQDSRGTTRIDGAINAVREFDKALAERCPKNQVCPKPQVSIVPFGDPGSACEKGYPVREKNLDKFFPAGNFLLSNYLDFLASEKPCASTNIYEPLSRAIRFLSNNADPRFAIPEDPNQPQPRLSVILLSDGYHNKANEEQDFENLRALLKRNEQIIVHTLGYGLTPEQLGQKYGLGRAATRRDIGKGDGKVPEEDFVDQARLAEIAQITGGVSEFSADAQTVAEKLKLFLNALLGEYQITYSEPNPERGSKHDVKVLVQSVESKPKGYTITAFGRSLPLPTRLIMLLVIFIVLIGGGVVPFWLWAEHLKREAFEG